MRTYSLSPPPLEPPVAPLPLPEVSAPSASAPPQAHAPPLRPDRAQSEQVFTDKKVIRSLFRNYRELLEKDELSKHDADAVSYGLPLHDRHDVMLDPYVFRRACRELRFKPTIDLSQTRIIIRCRVITHVFQIRKPKALTLLRRIGHNSNDLTQTLPGH